MRPRFACATAMLLILAVALALRLPRLNDRPFHGDEAVHAVKLRTLWEQGRYDYNPDEYHGPTIYYAALPVVAAQQRASLADTEEADYRLPIALLGSAMVLLYGLLRDGLGRQGALWAGLLTAVSAPFVFYSRYFIQEMALACFTLALVACGWRYLRTGGLGWLLAGAASGGLVIATKETSVLTFGALAVGCLAAGRVRRLGGVARVPGAHVLLGVAVAVTVAFVLLSGLLSNVRGPLGYFETYTPWLRRAGGTELHRHPWHYYLGLLAWQQPKGGPVWTELLVLGLAGVGAGATLLGTIREPRSKVAARPADEGPEEGGLDYAFPRFSLAYSVALAGVYSLIPYKTPWNLLSFHLGFILLAGLGAAALLSWVRPAGARAAAAVLLLAGSGHLAWQSARTTFAYRDDNTGPWAYAQPARGVREIEERVNALAAFSPQKADTVAQVISTDEYYWPLPWSLRRLNHVGYWSGRVPPEGEAGLKGTPILLSSPEFDPELTERLGATHFMVGFHSLRRGVLVQLWVRNDLWEGFIASRSRSQD